MKDLVFRAIDGRINRETSVLYWTYTSEKDLTTLEVEFIDQTPMFRVIMDPHNLSQVQETISIIDNYFFSKNSRS